MAATRFIEEEEFKALAALEGDTIALFKLVAIPFKPPTPDGEDMPDYTNYQNGSTIRVLMLNVSEPRLYKDSNGIVFVVLPGYDVVTYDVANDVHPTKDAWCYRMAPYTWNAGSDLADAAYLFSEAPLVPYDDADLSTH